LKNFLNYMSYNGELNFKQANKINTYILHSMTISTGPHIF